VQLRAIPFLHFHRFVRGARRGRKLLVISVGARWVEAPLLLPCSRARQQLRFLLLRRRVKRRLAARSLVSPPELWGFRVIASFAPRNLFTGLVWLPLCNTITSTGCLNIALKGNIVNFDMFFFLTRSTGPRRRRLSDTSYLMPYPKQSPRPRPRQRSQR
jgi:hypothetical protein